MAPTDTKVACWRVSSWITLYSWLQIMGAIFGIILAVRLYNPAEGSKLYPLCILCLTGFALIYGDRELLRIVSIILLVYSIIQFLFSALLLVGNRSEKPGLLLLWIVYRAVDLNVAVIFWIVCATKIANLHLTASMVWAIIAGSVISAFMIRVINHRIKDIKIRSGGVTADTEC